MTLFQISNILSPDARDYVILSGFLLWQNAAWSTLMNSHSSVWELEQAENLSFEWPYGVHTFMFLHIQMLGLVDQVVQRI